MSRVSHNLTTDKKPKLLNRACDLKIIRDAIRTKHYSIKTEEAYIHRITKYIFSPNKRHPKKMGEVEVKQRLNHLAVQGVRQYAS